MERPIWQMLQGAARRTSLHMPATGGREPFGRWNPYRFDTTEIPVTDDLYRPQGPMERAQSLAAASAGAAYTLMVPGGSTAGLQVMLLYAARPGERVIVPRHTHLSVLNLCALAGIQPLFPEVSYTAEGRAYTSLEAYQEAIHRYPEAKAVLVVRPDYYGLMPDLGAIAQAAHRQGMLALCDEAHGSYFNWHPAIPNAGACGADLYVQSAHKTLPALTAGAWLHAGPGVEPDRLRALLRMVQTSSPSFLTLLALDDARAWMDCHGAKACIRLEQQLARFYTRAAAYGYPSAQGTPPPGFTYDPLRLRLGAPQGGTSLADGLQSQGVDVELWDDTCVVGILPLYGAARPLKKLLRALGRLTKLQAEKRQPLPPSAATLPVPKRLMPMDQAAFAPGQWAPLESAAGRVSGAPVGLYPPGVALVTAGEVFSPETIAFLLAQPPGRVFGLHSPGRVWCLEEKGI